VKILVIGNGGREHAIIWKLAQSPSVTKIYCCPGNGGTAAFAENIKIENNHVLAEFAANKGIDLTVVGPEAPLSRGIVDAFQAEGLKIFGPKKRAAEIEASKALAKELMAKYNIPTAEYATFTDVNEAVAYVQEKGAPIVVKADGLAAGKGVIVAMDLDAALAAVRDILEGNSFGEAGSKVVIEEYLDGEEVSILAFTDGTNVIPMVSSQDHKRVFDNDEGPNTGGMGAYSPAPVYTEELAKIVERDVLRPTIDGLKAEDREYHGVIYAGLMITAKGVKVLEYNARFGDPETQPVLMRLETDLVEIIDAILEKRLDQQAIQWSPEATVCVVMASGGYPGDYPKGKVITGIEEANNDHVFVFHAGTASKDGQVVTSGGRVLGVTARGKDVKEAIERAYVACGKIHFDQVHYRRDIGYRALERMK
jgi:phosphoribosylamine--glycine ligase